jgi:hypothetical protein
VDDTVKQLSLIDPSQRILLLPHCLRQSNTCKAVYNDEGLQCQRCDPECSVNQLTAAAIEFGYKGVCVAPGGRLALKYVEKSRPQAVVAVACEKELMEGVEGVKALAKVDLTPLTVIIPLVKDGCVNTEVNVQKALEIIYTGCMQTIGNKPG